MSDAVLAVMDSTHDVRAGAIGPVRREIVFEPVHEQPAPAERPAVSPQPAEPATPKEPVPSRS